MKEGAGARFPTGEEGMFASSLLTEKDPSCHISALLQLYLGFSG